MKLHWLILSVTLLIVPEFLNAQVSGCTDPMAVNYNSTATINDGSCLYDPASVRPISGVELAVTLKETSGLINWNDQIWTHNDNSDVNIYGLDTVSGSIVQSCTLEGAVNNDWEEISQDNNYIYIGDFGNNANGNRKDLKILRIAKSSVLSGAPVIETINFSYSDQVNFDPAGANTTDFDCEAFIVSADSIFLFTKQWTSNKTSLYAFLKTPGTHVAELRSTFDVEGLITGAVSLESKRLVVLCGYSSSLDPFLFLLYDFSNNIFFSGNKRKITIEPSFHQVEGIATPNGLKYYISNEYFSLGSILTIPQKLRILDLSSYLRNYLNISTSSPENGTQNSYSVFPVPAYDYIYVAGDENPGNMNYSLINISGSTVISGRLPEENPAVPLSGLPAGVYFLKIEGSEKIIKVIKR